MVMKTFGPWHTSNHAHMKEIGHIVLSIMLVAKDAA
jgi:hypothetical protein